MKKITLFLTLYILALSTAFATTHTITPSDWVLNQTTISGSNIVLGQNSTTYNTPLKNGHKLWYETDGGYINHEIWCQEQGLTYASKQPSSSGAYGTYERYVTSWYDDADTTRWIAELTCTAGYYTYGNIAKQYTATEDIQNFRISYSITTNSQIITPRIRYAGTDYTFTDNKLMLNIPSGQVYELIYDLHGTNESSPELNGNVQLIINEFVINLQDFYNTPNVSIQINTSTNSNLNFTLGYHLNKMINFDDQIYDENNISIFNDIITLTNVYDDSLIAYYPLTNDANDYSGNDIHGTNYGATFADITGAEFDGINDYIELDSPLEELSVSKNWSIMIGFTTPADVSGTIGSLFGNTLGTNDRATIVIRNNEIQAGIYNGAYERKSGTILPSTDYIAIMTNNEGVVTLDLDNIEQTGISQPFASSGLKFVIGTTTTLSSTYFYEGKIRDVKIYNKTLSEAEKTAIFEDEKFNENKIKYSENFSMWDLFLDLTVETDYTDAPDGFDKSYIITSTGSNGAMSSTNTDVKADTTYVLSFWAKSNVPGSNNKVVLNDGANIRDTPFEPTSEWQKFEFTGTTGASPVRIRAQFGGANLFSTGESIKLAGVRLNEGSEPDHYLKTENNVVKNVKVHNDSHYVSSGQISQIINLSDYENKSYCEIRAEYTGTVNIKQDGISRSLNEFFSYDGDDDISLTLFLSDSAEIENLKLWCGNEPNYQDTENLCTNCNSTSLNFTGLTEGQHELNFNLGSVEYDFVFENDYTDPIITQAKSIQEGYKFNFFSVFNIDEKNLGDCTYTANNQTKDCYDSLYFPNNDDYTITYGVYDKAGNFVLDSGTLTINASYDFLEINSFEINITNVCFNTSTCEYVDENVSFTSENTSYIFGSVGEKHFIRTWANETIAQNLTVYVNPYQYFYFEDSSGSPIVNFSLNKINYNNYAAIKFYDLEIGNNNFEFEKFGLEHLSFSVNLNSTSFYNLTHQVGISLLCVYVKSRQSKALISKNVSISLIGDNFSNSYIVTNGTILTDEIAVLPGDYKLTFSSPGFANNEYYFTHTGYDIVNITTYLINESNTIPVKVIVRDIFQNPKAACIVKVKQYFISSNDYINVDMGQTNTLGEVIFDLEYDIYYQFVIVCDGVTQAESGQKITSTPIYIEFSESDTLTIFDEIPNLSYDLNFTQTGNTTGYFRFEYDDLNSIVSQGCLYLYQYDFQGNTLIDSTCQNIASGTLNLNVNGSEGEKYIAKGYLTYEGKSHFIDEYEKEFEFGEGTWDYGIGLWATMLVTLTLFLMGADLHPLAAIAFSWFGIFIAQILGAIQIQQSALIGVAALIIGVIIFRGNKR